MSQFISSSQSISNPTGSKSIVIIGMLLSAFLILSNLTADKIFRIGDLSMEVADVFFPIIYILNGLITEVYGFKASRRVIWTALLINLLVLGLAYLTVWLPPATEHWPHQEAYATIFSPALRMVVASTIACFFGEFLNATFLAKLKIVTQGRYLWLRMISSSLLGTALDSVLFFHLAFLGKLPYPVIWELAFMSYGFRILYESIGSPAVVRLARYLKRIDGIDYYDYHTKFSLFTMRLDD